MRSPRPLAMWRSTKCVAALKMSGSGLTPDFVSPGRQRAIEVFGQVRIPRRQQFPGGALELDRAVEQHEEFDAGDLRRIGLDDGHLAVVARGLMLRDVE